MITRKSSLCLGALAGLMTLSSVLASSAEAKYSPGALGAPVVAAVTPVTRPQGVILATSNPLAPTPTILAQAAPATPGPTATPRVYSAQELAAAPRYTVKQGDTLLSIARAFGVAPAVVQDANGISDPSLIKVGQVLAIPGGTQPAASGTAQPTQAPPTATAVPSPTAPPSAPAQPTAQPAPALQPGQPEDPLYFKETGFRIANDQFWEYFNRRGGVRTFGYPISKEFLLFGFRVQFFQRLIMQLKPDGTVSTMNLLDEGLMPYTRINGSTFPAPDAGMAGTVPGPGSEGYFDKLLAFVKEKSPDRWSDLGTNFYAAFNNTVKYEEAYPDRSMDPGIMPAINLELWGVPTSAPSYDPSNKNFVYLRFQRGIMHFDKTNGTTQGLLLGDYLKAIITGVNLPPDLEEQARGSRFYRQYDPAAASGISRPNDLPGTDMRGAFSRDGLVVLDPGHGGTQIGAAYSFPDGSVFVEKDLNLKIALKTADILRRSGRQVQLTRTADTQVNNPPRDITGDGRMTLDDDLQARVDIANNTGAAVFLSIHFNGNSNPDLRGTEVYYNAQRPFSDKNRKFAQTVLDSLVASTKAAGFNTVNRGIKPDETAVGKGNSFYLLGPADSDKPRATQMVGALGEGVFLTNREDAELLRQEKFLDALAAGYARAIDQYLQSPGR